MSTERVEVATIPAGLLEERGEERLHIGGTVARAGWKVLNALPGAHVDHLGDVRDLSGFASQSQDMVYASHVLEHLGYVRELPSVIRELARILKPGGRLLISVPNLDVLCRLFIHPSLDANGRLFVMRMMFGGQVNEYDFHKVGLTDELIAMLLREAGFAEIYRVPTFDIFDDTSNMKFGNALISVNMVAVR